VSFKGVLLFLTEDDTKLLFFFQKTELSEKKNIQKKLAESTMELREFTMLEGRKIIPIVPRSSFLSSGTE
jgi:hypothetical protein